MAKESLIEDVSSPGRLRSDWGVYRVVRQSVSDTPAPISQDPFSKGGKTFRVDSRNRHPSYPWDEDRLSHVEVRRAIRVVAEKYVDLSRRVAVLEAGPSEASMGKALDEALREVVAGIEGVDAILRHAISGRHVSVYVLAREHGVINRELLFDAEDDLKASLPVLECELVVRAHQGRPFNSVVAGGIVVFER